MAYLYPYGDGQQLNLDWFLAEWKNLLAAWEAEKNGIEGALQAEIDRAEAALADVFAARDAAAQSASDADASKREAAQSASDASGYLATVRADANTASNAARNAAQSESNAADSAQTALASKNAAGQSERNAAQSEQNALGYKNDAAQSAEDAQTAEQNVQDTIESATEQAITTATQSANNAASRAGNSASAAAQSEANALASKNAAAQSASDAEDAASSVEASAQQITTNTNNITGLKEIIDNRYPSIFYPLKNLPVSFSATGWQISQGNRITQIKETLTATEMAVVFTGAGNQRQYLQIPEAYRTIFLKAGTYKFEVTAMQSFERDSSDWALQFAYQGLVTGIVQFYPLPRVVTAGVKYSRIITIASDDYFGFAFYRPTLTGNVDIVVNIVAVDSSEASALALALSN